MQPLTPPPSPISCFYSPTNGASIGTRCIQVRLWLAYNGHAKTQYDLAHVVELGIPLRMPFLKSIIGNGTRFTKAFSPAPVCAPARSAIASGREYDQAGVACNFCNNYNTSIPTFYRLLRDQGGYHVMVTGKDDLTKVSAAIIVESVS